MHPLLYDPKEPASFHSQRWNSDTKPDLAFAHTVDTGIPMRRELDKFPRSQHRPSLISSPCLTAPIACKPVKRWNFLKANWETFKQMTDVATSQLPPHDIADTEDVYKAFCRILINSAKHSIPRGYNKNYIPCWDDECEQLYKEHIDSENTESASTAASLLNVLGEKRRQRWNETVLSIDFTHSSRKVWQTLNRLTGRSTLKTGKCPVTANSIAAQLVQNGRFPNHDREFTRQVSKEYISLWRAQSVDTDLARDFSYEELTIAFKHLRHGKAPGPDNIHAEFLIHAGDDAKEWLRKFFKKCLLTCKLPRIWRRDIVIAILKPNKPKDEPKSYSPILLLCIPYKIVERLIYNRISPVIDPQLPQEQAGFRLGRSTLDQVAKLTSDIELAFDGNLKGGAAFVDLTAAYDTVCKIALHVLYCGHLVSHHHFPCLNSYTGFQLITESNSNCTLLPHRHMVRFISELISNHSVVVKTSDGQQSRLKRINNGVPQGSVLSPLLFNVYIADLPQTNSKKYGYADDIALIKVHRDWNTIEETLSQDMYILSTWLKQWRVKLSEAKTVSVMFHLNNREAKRELNVNISGRRLTCQRTPALRGKVMARSALIRRLAGTSWGTSTPTLRTSTLALVYAPAEYCAPVWCRSAHTRLVDVSLNAALRTITGCLRPTQVEQLAVLAEIAPRALRREAATLVRPSRVPTRSSTTRHRGKFHPPKETKVTSPSHSPCSTTSVLCHSTRDGETLDQCSRCGIKKQGPGTPLV